MRIDEKTKVRMLKNLQILITDIFYVMNDRKNEKDTALRPMLNCAFSACVMLRDFLRGL